jgi:hypothetical protein
MFHFPALVLASRYAPSMATISSNAQIGVAARRISSSACPGCRFKFADCLKSGLGFCSRNGDPTKASSADNVAEDRLNSTQSPSRHSRSVANGMRKCPSPGGPYSRPDRTSTPGSAHQRIVVENMDRAVAFHLGFTVPECDASEEQARSAGLLPRLRAGVILQIGKSPT